MSQVFVKDGREVVCSSPTDAVNLKARGWTEKAEKPKPVHHKPEAKAEEKPDAEPDK